MGKKSWNVYNQDNIQKVKRDEAAAKAIEEAEEQRMQEQDSERRIQLLRGEIPTSLPEVGENDETTESRSYGPGRERKKRKKAGENDTDFEMRIAHEQASSNANKQIVLRRPINAPLTDKSGHIDLFPQEPSNKQVEKNAEAEKEAAKKKKEYEDQYTMRFSNAAGFKQGLENPWYSKTDPTADQPGTDVWGNEDPRRKSRQAAKIVSNDPLAIMRQGAAKARQVERERKRRREEREKELQELGEAEQRNKRRKRRHEEDDEDDFRHERSESSRRREEEEDRERRHRHKYRESRHSSHRDRDDENRHRHRHKHRRD